MNNRNTVLEQEWSERNAPLKLSDFSYGSNKVVWWQRACGHEWQASIKARSHGENCPICSNARIIPGVNDLAMVVPEVAEQWSKKNLPLLPTMVGAGSHKKAIWRGKCGHEWSAPYPGQSVWSRLPVLHTQSTLAGI